MTRPKIVRLWWRCSLCRWKVDAFGFDHTDEERRILAHDNRVHVHLAERHQKYPDTYSEVGALFVPAGATSRVVRKSVLVAPDEAGAA